jgi:hypothetical protein
MYFGFCTGMLYLSLLLSLIYIVKWLIGEGHGTVNWTQGLGLTFYHLSHVPRPFCFRLFSIYNLVFLLGPSLWLPSSYLCLPSILDYRCARHLTFLLRWSLTNFLAWLASQCALSNLCLPSSGDYKCQPPQLVCNVCLGFFLCVCGTGVWIQGFALAKQALYHLSHTSSPFCSGYFGDLVSWTICPGWLQTRSPNLSLRSS